DELILGVNIALGSQPASGCPSFQNAQRMVDIAQLIKGVNNALGSCPAGSTPTATATTMGSPPSPTVTVVTGTPTPTATQAPTVTPGGPCTGQLVGGFCWFLGALGESCDATCTGLGKTCSAGTVTYAGTGGTSAQCDAVLSALYPIFGPFEGDRACGTGGIGCAILFTEVGKPGFRCTDTPTDCAAMSVQTFSRACACQ